MLQRLTSEAAGLLCVIKSCTETAVSFLAESDATHSFTGPEERERGDARGRDGWRQGREEGGRRESREEEV